MKKTFQISHPKIKTARLFEAVKSEVKKYIKRETRKQLPAGVDYWDFDCKYGKTESTSDVIHVSQINTHIDQAEQEGLTSFYIEIMAKEGIRNQATTSDFDEEED
jgi:hypothetical protein